MFAQQAPGAAAARRRRRPRRGPMAPVDFTGVWVSVVSEDWRWRMMTPGSRRLCERADDAGRPERWPTPGILRATKRRANSAARTRRRPSCASPDVCGSRGRTTTPSGSRPTRACRPGCFSFNGPTRLLLTAPATAPRSWQGFSVARWEPQPAAFTGGGFGRGAAAPPITRSLEVTTTQIRPGYLRKNGVPFSEDAVLTEYYDAWRDPAGEWFTVMTVVRDPRYLRQPFVTTTDFKKEPNDAKWDPTPCQAR